MTAEVFNEFGRRNGYPIYVFYDRTFGSYCPAGKRVMFTIEGPIDMSPSTLQIASQAQEARRRTFPAEVAKPGFLDKISEVCGNIFGSARKAGASRRCVEDVEYEEPVREIVNNRSSDFQPQRYYNEQGNGVFRQDGADWSVQAQGLKNAKTYHGRQQNPDGSVTEIFVGNFEF